MTYLIWERNDGWHLSRRDGHTDEHTRRGNNPVELELYCKDNWLTYKVKPMDARPKVPELVILNKVTVNG